MCHDLHGGRGEGGRGRDKIRQGERGQENTGGGGSGGRCQAGRMRGGIVRAGTTEEDTRGCTPPEHGATSGRKARWGLQQQAMKHMYEGWANVAGGEGLVGVGQNVNVGAGRGTGVDNSYLTIA